METAKFLFDHILWAYGFLQEPGINMCLISSYHPQAQLSNLIKTSPVTCGSTVIKINTDGGAFHGLSVRRSLWVLEPLHKHWANTI